VFKKVMVANRGEMAVRVIRTCRALGIATAVVASDPDISAKHARMADEVIVLPGTNPLDTYLNHDKVLEAVARSRADAVHPGYGFLSENPTFAQAVTDLGVAFVGPGPEAIALMGDKAAARRTAEAAGVPVIPGLSTVVESPDQIEAFASAVGWPVAIKASFGGGGRGMRIARGPDEAAEALVAARSEAAMGFGRSEVYLELYLNRPRHIEIQVLLDRQGACVWFPPRDCSSQRRHQKLIEESPAPGLTREVVEAMGEAATSLARACNYVNAGTVEMLFEDGRFYFLEMNTRLQVEHPVTEMVTGVDLVELQLRIAAGQTLDSLALGMSGPTGHAIEARINAEDPSGGRFTPSPGRITAITLPSGPGIRVDEGYDAGDEVSPFYDNLIAKVVAHGPDRETARRRLLGALGEIRIEGLTTNAAAHERILASRQFVTGTLTTRSVEEELDMGSLLTGPAVTGPGGQRSAPREVVVDVGGRAYRVRLFGLDAAPTAATVPARGPRTAPAEGDGTVVAPMQGLVTRMMVEAGDRVEVGQPVLILEAMKMENVIAATSSGTVVELLVGPGDSVGAGDPLVKLEGHDHS
jgi:acetyl-CoA/propionyl-CoA carboxylase biotin carboxyl carrier protein